MTNLDRLAARLGVADLPGTRRYSVENPAAFWGHVAADLRHPLADARPVLDQQRGDPFADWWPGAPVNLAATCLDHPYHRPAVVEHTDEHGIRTASYGELAARANGIANWLTAQHLTGQTVAVLSPPGVDTAACFLGTWLAGATVLPLFTGHAAPAIATRLRHARVAAVLVPSPAATRKGRPLGLADTARAAAAMAPTTRHVLDGHVDWPAPTYRLAVPPDTTADTDALLIYTSGSTGAPKGVVHSHGGFGVKVAAELAYQFDVQPEDRVLWCSDTGWIMFVWELVGALTLGATAIFSAGAYEDVPALAKSSGATVLGATPGLLARAATGPLTVRAIGSSGEPWPTDPAAWHTVRDRAPIVNISGGTEVGTNILAHHLGHDTDGQEPGELGGPALGMNVVVSGGELCVRGPWPGMTRGLWAAPRRYLDTYWRSGPDGWTWHHGDEVAVRGVDGRLRYWIPGRVDDQINVQGRRVACAEVEDAARTSPAVSAAACRSRVDRIELAVVGDPHAASAAVVEQLGPAFRPARAVEVPELPRTDSGKVLRTGPPWETL